jgi:hypothetical protein
MQRELLGKQNRPPFADQIPAFLEIPQLLANRFHAGADL